MTLVSPKEQAWGSLFPRGLSTIASTIIVLAAFLTMASLLLASYPIGSAVRGYFYGVRIQRGEMLVVEGEQHVINSQITNGSEMQSNQITSDTVGSSLGNTSDNNLPHRNGGSGDLRKIEVPASVANQNAVDSGSSRNRGAINKDVDTEPKENKGLTILKPGQASANSSHDVKSTRGSALPNVSEAETEKSLSPLSSQGPQGNKKDVVDPGCDLYNGQWFYDSSGPLYTNNTCPILTQMQNCQGNGRPDRDYENWRWKPSHCNLPRFDAKKFLELMRGKTLAFIGDSVSRNQMESMLCILWQVEVPKNRGNRKMQRWWFKSTSTYIVRMWSSWLVHHTSEKFDYAPEGVEKLHLDAPDTFFMEEIPKFDVVVLSSGHWFAKQSVYILNNEIVGGQLWWPDKSRPMKIHNVAAFGISVETILTAMATHPNYKGLTIVRSYSPDHYEGGAWNTGGSCTGKEKPAADSELVENGFTNTMHELQEQGFNKAIKKANNGSKLRLMDITKAFSYRHDGHPGPYRNPDPHKLTKRGPDGRPPPQDCLHWCMPGPVDTWNELVLEIIRREFEGTETSAS